MSRGFTLIETVIYIGLFALLIGGLLISLFQIIQNVRNTGERIMSESEMAFVVRKIDSLINGASDLEVVSSNLLKVTNGSITYVTKNGDEIDFCDNSSCSSGHVFPLTTTNSQVEELTFIAATGTPKGVNITIVIDGNTAKLTKYLKI